MNPGQNATNQTRTKCHKTKTRQNATERKPDKMRQNKDASKI